MENAKRIIQDKDDKAMIQHPDLWPNWPLLPVKRYRKDQPGSLPEIGTIFAGDSTTVFKASIFNFNPDSGHYLYQTIDELLADGWMVD